MVDAVILQWVTLVIGEEAVPKGFGRSVKWLADFLYANHELLASPQLDQLQAVLDVLPVLLDRVVLHTNINKTLGMVYHPCRMAGRHSEAVYASQMIGVGPLYKEQQRNRVI